MSLPRLLAGVRKRLMARLVLNGVGQAFVTFGAAWLLREGLASQSAGLTPPLIATEIIFAGLVAAGAALLALRILERVDAEKLGLDYVMKTRLRLFERIVGAPRFSGKKTRFGLTMNRLVTDLNSLKNWVSLGLARMVVACVSLVGTSLTLAYFSPRAAVVVAGVVLAAGAIGVAITPILRKLIREARHRRGRLAGNLGEKVFAADTVSHFGKTKAELKQLRLHSKRLTDAMVRRMRVSALLRSLPEAAFPLAIAAFVGLLLFWPGGGGAAEGEIVIALLIFGMIVASLRNIAQAWDYRLNFEEARRRLNVVLSYPRITEASDTSELEGDGPIAISYSNIRVAETLASVSCGAKAGEHVLITGPSGSGKTTLLALAARFFDPDDGEISLNGHPLQSLSLSSVHAAVQLVSPDLALLRGTVADNIGYGMNGDAAPDRLERVAKLCGLNEKTELLPEGLGSKVEEKARNLPDGLRARISLARALCAGPRLLLIDDPIFAVDDQVQAALQRVLNETDVTMIMVGHEHQNCFQPDQIWHLSGGALEVRRPARAHWQVLPGLRAAI